MSHPRDILLSLEANARKSLSQNFLVSPHWADRLTQAVIDTPNVDEFWEIGPGLGALTAKLLEKAGNTPVKIFEYDRKLSAYLRERFPKAQLFEGDFLQADLASLLSPSRRVGLLSNLPYHLSSPILFKLMEFKQSFPRLVLTFQKEYAERLYAQPGSKDYGQLSVLMQLSFHLQSLGTLPPGAFYPAPGVSSEAVWFEPRTLGEVPLESLSRVVKTAFQHRRKKVSGNLKQGFPNAPIDAILEELHIANEARPETLTKQDYLALTEKLSPHFPIESKR